MRAVTVRASDIFYVATPQIQARVPAGILEQFSGRRMKHPFDFTKVTYHQSAIESAGNEYVASAAERYPPRRTLVTTDSNNLLRLKIP